MALKSGHRIVPVTCEEAVKRYEQFHSCQTGSMRLDPDGWFFITPFVTFGDMYYNFKFKPSDVVIMTYPKSGSTWTQEIVWTMLYNPNFNNPKASLPIKIRSPFMDLDFLTRGLPVDLSKPGSYIHDKFVQTYPNRNPKDGIFLQFAELTEDPRIIKTHLPFPLLSSSLPDTAKVIYVTRQPKDVAVSYCHHSKLMKGLSFVGTTSEFVDHFVNDSVLFSPYWTHLKEAWRRRNQTNILFIFYEDMKANPKAEILRIQKFLDLNLTESQIDKIVHYTSFDVMKQREEKNLMGPGTDVMMNLEIRNKDGGFYRKGVTGDYKNKLSKEDIEKIDNWTRKNTRDMEDEFKYKNI